MSGSGVGSPRHWCKITRADGEVVDMLHCSDMTVDSSGEASAVIVIAA